MRINQYFDLAAELIKYRETKKLTQKDIANLLNVTQASVSRIEQGASISTELGLKIQRLLNQAVMEFLPKFKIDFFQDDGWAVSSFNFPPKRAGGDRVIVESSLCKDRIIILHVDAAGLAEKAAREADQLHMAFYATLSNLAQNQINLESIYGNLNTTVRKTKEFWRGEPAVGLLMLQKEYRRLWMLNAGIPRALLYKKEKKSVEEAGEQQFVSLGSQKSSSMAHSHSIELASGDLLFVASDGFIEEFGRMTHLDLKVVIKALAGALKGDPEGIALKLLRLLGEGLTKSVLDDDISFTIIASKRTT